VPESSEVAVGTDTAADGSRPVVPRCLQHTDRPLVGSPASTGAPVRSPTRRLPSHSRSDSIKLGAANCRLPLMRRVVAARLALVAGLTSYACSKSTSSGQQAAPVTIAPLMATTTTAPHVDPACHQIAPRRTRSPATTPVWNASRPPVCHRPSCFKVSSR